MKRLTVILWILSTIYSTSALAETSYHVIDIRIHRITGLAERCVGLPGIIAVLIAPTGNVML